MKNPCIVKHIIDNGKDFWIARSLVLKDCVAEGKTEIAAVKELEKVENSIL